MGIASFIRQAFTADHAAGEVVLEGSEFLDAAAYYGDALGVAAIFRARQLNADTIGSLPVRLRSSGDTPPDPNPDQDWGDLLAEAVLAMQDHGHALFLRDGDTITVADNRLVDVGLSEDRRRTVWRYDTERLRTRGNYAAEAFPAVMNQTKVNPGGVGWMQSARIRGVLAAQAYVEDYYRNQARPGGILKVPGTYTEEETDKLLERWMDLQGSRRPAVMSQSMDWTDTGFSPSDSQWVETHRIDIGDVALLAGLPGALLDYNTPGASLTYQSLGDIQEQTWRTTWNPYYVRRLTRAVSRAIRAEVELDPEGLFLASLTSRSTAAAQLTQVGYDPADVADRVGLDGLKHTGQVPTTIREVTP